MKIFCRRLDSKYMYYKQDAYDYMDKLIGKDAWVILNDLGLTSFVKVLGKVGDDSYDVYRMLYLETCHDDPMHVEDEAELQAVLDNSRKILDKKDITCLYNEVYSTDELFVIDGKRNN